MMPRGWRLTWILSLGLLLMSTWMLVAYGTGEEGVRTWIRATARSSAALFLLTFLARPLHQLWRNDRTRFLMKNRRHVGVSVGVSHFLHLIGILWLVEAWPEASAVDPVTLVFGGLGFAFLFAMALTSSNAAVAALGRNWRRLHKTGAWYAWFIFALTFIPQSGWTPLYVVAVAAFVGAALLRLALHLRRGRADPAPIAAS